MTITYPAEDLTPPVGRPTNASPGRYEFEAVPFSLNGEWQVDVLVVRPDAFDTRLAYSFEVGGEDDTAAVGSDAIVPDKGTAGWLFGGMLLFLLVLAGAIILRRRILAVFR
jgi:hypothetical protein